MATAMPPHGNGICSKLPGQEVWGRSNAHHGGHTLYSRATLADLPTCMMVHVMCEQLCNMYRLKPIPPQMSSPPCPNAPEGLS